MDTAKCHDYLCTPHGVPEYGFTRVFLKLTKLAIMAILTSEALLRKQNPVAKCYPQWE